MEHLAEESLLCHVQCGQLEEVVDAVLEHHAVQTGALCRVDELPYLVHVHGGRHLDGHMLAVLHGIEGDGHVVHPVGGNVDEVDVVAPAHLLIGFGAAAIGCGTGAPELLKQLLAVLHTVGLHVAEALHGGALYLGKALDGTRAAHAQPDEAHAHRVEWCCGKSEHIMLPGGAAGHRRLNHFH